MKQLKIISTIILPVVFATLIGCASTSKKEDTSAPKKESAGEYIDDSVITAKVKKAVFDESTLKSSEINVETYKGVVQLSGFVNSQADIYKAIEVANSVKGVTSVKNDMRVKAK